MPDTLDKSRYPPVEVERTDAESSVTLNTLIPQCENDTQPAVPLKGNTKGLTPVDHLAHWIARGKEGGLNKCQKIGVAFVAHDPRGIPPRPTKARNILALATEGLEEINARSLFISFLHPPPPSE